MVRRRKLILKAIIMCLMPVLMLALFVGKTYAYWFDENDNIHSSNLLDINNVIEFGSLSIYNGTVTGSDTKGYFAFQVQFYNNDTFVSATNVGDYYNTGVVSYTFTKTSSFNYIQFGHNGSSNDVKIRYYIGDLTNSSSYTLSLNLLSTSYTKQFNHIMLNEGSSAMNYEPYGMWFAEGNNPSIYYLINNAQFDLYSSSYNGGSYSYVMTELYHYVDGNLIDYSGIPNIYERVRTSEDTYYRINIKLKQPTNHIITFSFGDSFMEYDSVLANSMTGRSYTFERSGSTIVCDTSSNYYDTITLTGLYSPDYIRFNMFISDDSYSYSYGYNNGYSEGHSDGVNEASADSFASGESYGYQRGYNDGSTSNLETNGMKTLFNSILSFPVNMIKSVFNFEFMGINVASVIMFVISIGIVAFVIKKFL